MNAASIRVEHWKEAEARDGKSETRRTSSGKAQFESCVETNGSRTSRTIKIWGRPLQQAQASTPKVCVWPFRSSSLEVEEPTRLKPLPTLMPTVPGAAAD